eukprot:6827036-Pyramimonas_sp.AAC.1
MLITDKFFCKQHRGIFTCAISGYNKTQSHIDCVLLDQSCCNQLIDSLATSAPDLGSDHQAVCMQIVLNASAGRKRKKRKCGLDRR